MSSQSTQNDSDTQVDIILAHKKKNLTVFEYVIANEKVTVAPPGSFIVIRIDGRRFKGYVIILLISYDRIVYCTR